MARPTGWCDGMWRSCTPAPNGCSFGARWWAVKSWSGKGCNACAHTGYRGRSGLYEVMTMTDQMREAFSNDAPREELVAQAHADGMVSMRHDGMMKVQEGITTPYEMLRVLFSLD